MKRLHCWRSLVSIIAMVAVMTSAAMAGAVFVIVQDAAGNRVPLESVEAVPVPPPPGSGGADSVTMPEIPDDFYGTIYVKIDEPLRDLDGDGKIGLPDAIQALRTVAGASK